MAGLQNLGLSKLSNQYICQKVTKKKQAKLVKYYVYYFTFLISPGVKDSHVITSSLSRGIGTFHRGVSRCTQNDYPVCPQSLHVSQKDFSSD